MSFESASLTYAHNSDIEIYLKNGGKDLESRFGEAMINMNPEEISLGAPTSYLDSHSQRRGSITYILGFPIIADVQIYLRADEMFKIDTFSEVPIGWSSCVWASYKQC